jgi:hypothetical protein
LGGRERGVVQASRRLCMNTRPLRGRIEAHLGHTLDESLLLLRPIALCEARLSVPSAFSRRLTQPFVAFLLLFLLLFLRVLPVLERFPARM